MADHWYFQVMGESHGPFSFVQLEDLAARRQIEPHFLVRNGSGGDWISAENIPNLFVTQARTEPNSPQRAKQSTAKNGTPISQHLDHVETKMVPFAEGLPAFSGLRGWCIAMVALGTISYLVAVLGAAVILASENATGEEAIFWFAGWLAQGNILFITACLVRLFLWIGRNTFVSMRASVEAAKLLEKLANRAGGKVAEAK